MVRRKLFEKLNQGDKFCIEGDDSLYIKVSATYYRDKILINAVKLSSGDFSFIQSNQWVNVATIGLLQQI